VLSTQRLTGVAHEVTAEPGRLVVFRQMLLASGFAAVVGGLDPRIARTRSWQLRRGIYSHPDRVDRGPGL